MLRKNSFIIGISIFFTLFSIGSFTLSLNNINFNDLRPPVTLPSEITTHLKKYSDITEIYELGIKLKSKTNLIKDRMLSIKCFEYIVEKYREHIPLFNPKLKYILAKSYYEIAKYEHKLNLKEMAFIDFLIAKDLGIEISEKYLAKIELIEILKTIYQFPLDNFYNSVCTTEDLQICMKSYEYIISKLTSILNFDLNKYNKLSKFNQDLLRNSYFHLGTIGFITKNYEFAEKQFRSALYLGSHEAMQFIRSKEWIDQRAFPILKSSY